MSVWVSLWVDGPMKIYVLLLLISVIVGVSYLPLRRPAKVSAPMLPAPVSSESVTASI